VKNSLPITPSLLVILVPPLHAGGTGILDEIVSVIGTIIFIVILIHMIFFEKRDDKPIDETKSKDSDDKN